MNKLQLNDSQKIHAYVYYFDAEVSFQLTVDAQLTEIVEVPDCTLSNKKSCNCSRVECGNLTLPLIRRKYD